MPFLDTSINNFYLRYPGQTYYFPRFGNKSLLGGLNDLGNLGTALRDLGDAAAAKALYERALKIKKQHYGAQHPEVAITLCNLGAALATLGDLKAAAATLSRALRNFQRTYADTHPYIQSAKKALQTIKERLPR